MFLQVNGPRPATAAAICWRQTEVTHSVLLPTLFEFRGGLKIKSQAEVWLFAPSLRSAQFSHPCSSSLLPQPSQPHSVCPVSHSLLRSVQFLSPLLRKLYFRISSDRWLLPLLMSPVRCDGLTDALTTLHPITPPITVFLYYYYFFDSICHLLSFSHSFMTC